MNRANKELYKQVDEVLKELASQVPIEDVCIKALSLMEDANVAEFIKIKLRLRFLISSNTPLEEDIKTLASIKADLEEINKMRMVDMAKMRKILDDIEGKFEKEIKGLDWAVAKLIEGFTKKIEKKKDL